MTSKAVQLQEDATGWADEFGGISQAAEQWADQFAEQIVPNEEVCPCWHTFVHDQVILMPCLHLLPLPSLPGSSSVFCPP